MSFERFNYLSGNCLEWSVEKPFGDTVRESPKFSYLGNEWSFRLRLSSYRNGKTYSFRINPTDNKVLDKHARITAVIHQVQCRELMYLKACVVRTSQAEYSFEMLDTIPYRHFMFHFIFKIDLPSELHIKESETNPPISNLTVELLDTAGIVRKAKLAANAADDYLSDEDILSSDFGKLLEQQSTSDVTLTCRDRCFSAHRLILAARSEVFSAMFQNKMIESETGKIDITDIDGEVMELLLKYVYTGKISDLSVEIASSLYIAADKYSIQSLKNKCLKWMWECLTEENCLEFLLLAATCNDEKFKDSLVNFVAKILHLLKKDEWQTFSAQHPELALNVYQKRVFK